MEVVGEKRYMQVGCYRSGGDTGEVVTEVSKESLFQFVLIMKAPPIA